MVTAARDTANKDEFVNFFAAFRDAPEWKDDRQVKIFTATLSDVDALHIQMDEVKRRVGYAFEDEVRAAMALDTPPVSSWLK